MSVLCSVGVILAGSPVRKQPRGYRIIERYFSPLIEVIYAAPEGVVCASEVDADGLGVGNYSNPFGDTEVPLF